MSMSAFEGKADIPDLLSNVRYQRIGQLRRLSPITALGTDLEAIRASRGPSP
jgi:hypothetical protein